MSSSFAEPFLMPLVHCRSSRSPLPRAARVSGGTTPAPTPAWLPEGTYPKVAWADAYISAAGGLGPESNGLTLANPQPNISNVSFSQVRAYTGTLHGVDIIHHIACATCKSDGSETFKCDQMALPRSSLTITAPSSFQPATTIKVGRKSRDDNMAVRHHFHQHGRIWSSISEFQDCF